ncbi:histidine kinase [Nocardiopsis sp. L17-MgMaSL7]|uniref:sensor histidine kinase n=1 Tax=Nocardiopsis sp. L17-MgMaSL7 TaxID=1938893 RepID=UPI000D959D78|nr:histidine kinase [Nocardiopsis sp. L17-MgMaSL7]PWV55024.1 signal transduction histidine kinase [Nocardiopsis sp. L17-MgMaSL7]
MSGTREERARSAERGGGRVGARLTALAGVPFASDLHGSGWRLLLVQVLHLMTSLTLALFYLIPVSLLVMVASWIGVGLFLPWTDIGSTYPASQIVRDSLGFLVALPVTATLLARLACRVQRDRLANVFGIVEADPPDPLADDNPWTRVWRFVFGRDAWTMVVYSTAAGLHGLFAAGLVVVFVVCGGAAAIGASLGIAYILALGTPGDLVGPLILVVVGPLAAVVGLRLAPHMISTEVLLHRLLLFEAPEVRMRRRLLHVQDSRLRMVDEAEAERRRIERDLHDGAQQRLLALTMTLTRARARLSHDPDGARELISEAQKESREVMTELRQVARGLHPRVLTDHGLGAALPVAAGRSPVPVRLDVDLPERPSARAEGVAYYVVCEALTNIAKHADAEQVTVTTERIAALGRGGELLRVTVTDDGVGGADPETGTGLYGLWDRVDAVDGILTVHSPTGGGTVLTANIPWKA